MDKEILSRHNGLSCKAPRTALLVLFGEEVPKKGTLGIWSHERYDA